MLKYIEIENNQLSESVSDCKKEIMNYNNPIITASRERLYGEVIPQGVEHSSTEAADEEKWAAAHSVDLDFTTRSGTNSGPGGTSWLKLTLNAVHCVEQVVRYNRDGNPYQTWTCSMTDCSGCHGNFCSDFSLSVFGGTLTDGLPPLPICKYGDTVNLQKDEGSRLFNIVEIAITVRQSEFAKNNHY